MKIEARSVKHWHSRERCDCLITAAGLSSRMGAWKLMLPYRQSTILDESLKNALVLCDRVILVVGHRADELISRYANHPRIRLVHNHDYAQGLGSSIRAGLAACSSDHLFVSHGDLPCIPRGVPHALAGAGDETLFPSYQGKLATPCCCPEPLPGRWRRHRHRVRCAAGCWRIPTVSSRCRAPPSCRMWIPRSAIRHCWQTKHSSAELVGWQRLARPCFMFYPLSNPLSGADSGRYHPGRPDNGGGCSLYQTDSTPRQSEIIF